MSTYSLSHLADSTLLRDLAALVTKDRATTAALLAHLAEVDARKLYLPAAYPSIFAYCVGEHGMSEDSAYKRIRAARAAYRFPAIFAAVADGRLNLNAVVLLAPYLTEDTADELLAAAAGRTRSEVEQLVAQRFPRPDLPTVLETIGPVRSPASFPQLAARPVGTLAPDAVAPAALEPTAAPVPRARVEPLAPERFALQVTIGQGTHDKLRYAQSLLSHQLPSGDVAEVLDRALDALIRRLERRKFAATARPRPGRRRSTAGGRYIPADVRRAVWERDGGRCTFLSETGQRCPARDRLEFDHEDEVARGGQATVERIRLRCRAHNQYGAELTFGTGFMSDKRECARRAAAERATPAKRAEAAAHAARAVAATQESEERDVIPWLRQLRFRADEARRAAEFCETLPDVSLKERVRTALSFLGRRHRRTPAASPIRTG